jgi:hypothetical protein
VNPERSPLEAARHHLERAAEREPLYKAGTFVLAYAMLQQGDSAQAQPLFASLTESSNQQAKLRFQSAKEQWPGTAMRGSWLAERIKPLNRLLLPWLQHWMHITILLRGGTFHRLAQEWTEFPARLERYNRAVDQKIKFEQHSFELYIHGFRVVPDIHKLARIAAGLETGEVTAEEARLRLDELLSVDQVDRLDGELSELERKLTSAKVDTISHDVRKSLGEEVDPAERDTEPPDMEPVKQTVIVDSFSGLRRQLDELRAGWRAERWDRCKRLLRDLRDQTRAPDDHAASRLLEDVSLFQAGLFRPPDAPPVSFPRLERWLVGLFIPAYGLLEPWRDSFGTGFVLESEYYLALADYRTFTSAEIAAAMRQAKRLNTLLLVGKAPATVDLARYEELRFLAQCLEIDAIVRILLGEKSDPVVTRNTSGAGSRLDALNAEVIPRLRTLLKDRTAHPHVLAAVSRSLGLIERYDPARSRVWHRGVDESDKPPTEFEYLSSGLTLERAPDSCFYLAEHLLASDRRAEAKSHVDEALRLCPRHAGALALRAKLTAENADDRPV